jgi:hypothetical protein
VRQATAGTSDNVDIGGKFVTRVIDTGGKSPFPHNIATGVNHTSGK